MVAKNELNEYGAYILVPLIENYFEKEKGAIFTQKLTLKFEISLFLLFVSSFENLSER